MIRLYISIQLFLAAIAFKLDLPVCKRDMPNLNECLINSNQAAIDVIARGEPKLDIKSVEPFVVESLEITNEGGGPVTINQKYHHLLLHGISNTTITSCDVKKITDNEVVIDAQALIPYSIVEADYEIEGKILLLPIVGKGQAKYTFHNARLIYTLYFNVYEKKGNHYLKLTKLPFHLEPDRIDIWLNGLFDGNERLQNEMLQVLNENWRSVYQELKEPFEQVVGKLFFQFLNHYYSKVPIEWFLEI